MNTTDQSPANARSLSTASLEVEEDEPPVTWRRSLIAIVRYSWLNVLLVCVPISWALHFAHVSQVAVFAVSALAILPCAALLGLATEEIAHRAGPTVRASMRQSDSQSSAVSPMRRSAT